jgi:hypothetical protein
MQNCKIKSPFLCAVERKSFKLLLSIELKDFVGSELLVKAISLLFSGLLNKSQSFIGQNNKCKNKMILVTVLVVGGV